MQSLLLCGDPTLPRHTCHSRACGNPVLHFPQSLAVSRAASRYGLQQNFPPAIDDPEAANYGMRPQFLGDANELNPVEAALLAVPVFYAGGEWDAEAQLYVLGGKFYEPYSGRWITDGGGENGYQFADNNPTRERVIGETGLSDNDLDSIYGNSVLRAIGETARGFIGDEALAAATNGELYAGVGATSIIAGIGLFYGGSFALSGIAAGATAAGTTVGTYLGFQAGLSAVETGLEMGLTAYFGSDVSVGGALATFGKNFAVNSVTGGLGGFFARQAVEIGADTTLDVARGQDALSSLAFNTVGSLGGEAVFRGLGRAVNSGLAHQAYVYAGGFRRGYFSAGQSSIFVGSSLGGAEDIGHRLAAGHRLGVQATSDTGLAINRYATLSKSARPGQAHHLNQAAAYSDVIPFNEGVSIKLHGNIFTDAGAPHTRAHQLLESFWNQYRGTDLVPTNLQYTRALQQSLRASGLTEPQVQQAVRAAIRERIQYGLLGGLEVPRVPNPISNLAR